MAKILAIIFLLWAPSVFKFLVSEQRIYNCGVLIPKRDIYVTLAPLMAQGAPWGHKDFNSKRWWVTTAGQCIPEHREGHCT